MNPLLIFLFGCDVAKYAWSLVAYVLGASNRLGSFAQFWMWISSILQHSKQFHMVGLAAICWAIWKARNNICFEKKIIRSTEIVCSVISFLNYWAG